MSEYIMKGCSKRKLERNGFLPHAGLSGIGETYYTYRFIVYHYRGIPTVEAELIVCLETGCVTVEVVDKNTRSKYAGWYLRGTLGYCGRNYIVEGIDDKIKKKMKYFKIEEVT